jgi:hypothetical protein
VPGRLRAGGKRPGLPVCKRLNHDDTTNKSNKRLLFIVFFVKPSGSSWHALAGQLDWFGPAVGPLK